jgi:hypothetical protein
MRALSRCTMDNRSILDTAPSEKHRRSHQRNIEEAKQQTCYVNLIIHRVSAHRPCEPCPSSILCRHWQAPTAPRSGDTNVQLCLPHVDGRPCCHNCSSDPTTSSLLSHLLSSVAYPLTPRPPLSCTTYPLSSGSMVHRACTPAIGHRLTNQSGERGAGDMLRAGTSNRNQRGALAITFQLERSFTERSKGSNFIEHQLSVVKRRTDKRL